MHTLKIIKSILVLIPLFMLFSCGVTFDEEHPYSVQVSRFRYAKEAKDQLEKLKSKGLDAFLYTSHSEEGQWHHLLIGVDDVLERTMEKKIEYEDKFGLKKLTIVNYNSMQAFEPFEAVKNSYDLDKQLFLGKEELDLLDYTISPDGYLVERFTLLSRAGLSQYFDSELMRASPMDLPRGIAHHFLFKKVDLGMEFIFNDPVTGRNVTAQLFKLKEEESFLEVKEALTQKIFNTRVYQKEEVLPWGNDHNVLSGNLVSIKPSNDKVMRYGIAGDEEKKILLLVQSSDNNSKFWGYLIKGVGDSQFLIEDPIYYNLLSSEQKPKDDCLKIVLKRNNRQRTKYDKLIYGYYDSDIYWSGKGQLWATEMIVFNDSTETNSYFQTVVERQHYNRNKVDTLSLTDSTLLSNDILVKTLRKSLENNGKRTYLPYKAFTKEGNLFLEVSNTKSSYLSSIDLRTRIDYFKKDKSKSQSILDKIF